MSGHVDLSLAKHDDVCHLRDGRTEKFTGPNTYQNVSARFWLYWKPFAESHPYVAGSNCYRRDGGWAKEEGVQSPDDIVRVTRDGIQVTPAPPSNVTGIQRWVATAPPEIMAVFQSVDVRNFLRTKRNERFQMIGKYDGSISDECRQSFQRDYDALSEFLEASKPASAKK